MSTNIEAWKLREKQLRVSAVHRCIAFCEKHNVTLLELHEHYSSYLDAKPSNALARQRSKSARIKKAKHAVNTRHQRSRDFLEGFKSRQQEIEEQAKNINLELGPMAAAPVSVVNKPEDSLLSSLAAIANDGSEEES